MAAETYKLYGLVWYLQQLDLGQGEESSRQCQGAAMGVKENFTSMTCAE